MPQPLCVCCRKHRVDPAWRPFCSERCKLQDLVRWADGHYRVAGEKTSDADDSDGDSDGDSENEKV